MTAAGPSGRRLRKRDVEALLSAYDTDPVGALEAALRSLTGRTAATFDALVEGLVGQGGLTPARARALLGRDVAALDALAAELNETRELPS